MRKAAGFRVAIAVLMGVAGSLAYGQGVISARSGMVHYIEGDVFIGDRAIEEKSTVYNDTVKDGEVLRTEEGRAEVLLTPGVFLRLRENSSFKMISSQLSDTQVEAISGSVLLEVGELLKENAITLRFKDQTIRLAKSGLYRVDCDASIFRAYGGEAVVSRAGGTFTVRGGKYVNLDAAVLTATSFDNKVGDEFYRWAARRANYLSIANMASARQARDSGLAYSSSQWVYNPWYDMFTYMPYRGYYNSPFGFGFWSPLQIGYADPYYYGYYPGYGSGYGGGGGGTTTSTRSNSSIMSGDVSRPSNGVSGGSVGGGTSSGSVSSGASLGGGRSAGGGGTGSSGGSAGGGRGH